MSTYLSLRKRLSRQHQQQNSSREDLKTSVSSTVTDVSNISRESDNPTENAAANCLRLDSTKADIDVFTNDSPLPPPSSELLGRALSRCNAAATLSKDAACTAPTRAKLQRYKNKSPAKSNIPTIKVEPASPGGNVKVKSLGRSSDSKINSSSSPSRSSSRSISPASPTSTSSSETVKHRVGRVEFEIVSKGSRGSLNSDESTKITSKSTLASTEMAPGNVNGDNLAEPRKRIKRSQTRREERTHIATLFNGNPQQQRVGGNGDTNQNNGVNDVQNVLDPETVVLRKVGVLPPSTDDGSTEDAAGNANTTTPFNSPTSASKKRTDSVQLGQDGPADLNIEPAQNTSSILATNGNTQNSRDSSATSPSSSDTDNTTRPFSKIQSTPLSIPMFDPTRSKAWLWTSHAASNSHPSEPWGWDKRWTCHKCNSQTIVEQRVCANLMCGHERCSDYDAVGGGCRLIKRNIGGISYD